MSSDMIQCMVSDYTRIKLEISKRTLENIQMCKLNSTLNNPWNKEEPTRENRK